MEFCVFTEPQQGYEYEELLASAQLAERLGFDGWFRSDHYLSMGAGDGLPGPTDAWTTLAGLARETERIRLGTLVSSVTYRSPGILAIQVAQVDRMSGGRVELGLGTGWFEAEHTAYAIPFPAKRFGLLEEQLQIVPGLWSTPVGETFSFAGEHYEVIDSPGLPKPVQSQIPVIVGGNGAARTPRLAARYATEYNSNFQDNAGVAAAFARVRSAAEEIERDPETIKFSVALTTVAGESDTEVSRRAGAIGRDLGGLRSNGLAGTRPQIEDRIAALRDLGVQRLYVQLLDLADTEQVELVADITQAFRS